MILKTTFLLIFLASSLFSHGQLVRKRDYDAAFAVQAGVNTGIAIPGKPKGLKADGIYGLKMTFPFNRKWFLGAEINYNPLRLEAQRTIWKISDGIVHIGPHTTEIELQTLNIPVYMKYMLRNNRTGILLGGYFSWHLKGEVKAEDTTYLHASGTPDLINIFKYESNTDKWDVGLTAGIEQKLLKHLNLLFKVSGSVKGLVKKENHIFRNIFPLQAHLTLSYDIFRIGDCGCD